MLCRSQVRHRPTLVILRVSILCKPRMAQKKIAFSLCAIISHHACPGKEGILGCHPDLAGRDLQRGTLTRESRGRTGRARVRGNVAHGPAQRGVQGAVRLPVRHLRPDVRQGEHPAAAVATSARRRGGEEDRPPASPGPRAHWLSGQVVSHLLQCKDSHYHQTYTWL